MIIINSCREAFCSMKIRKHFLNCLNSYLQCSCLFLAMGFVLPSVRAEDAPSIQQLQEIVVGPCSGIPQMNLYCASPKEPTAVLVVLSFYGGKPRELAALSQKTQVDIQHWADIATQHQLAFVYADSCIEGWLPSSVIAGNYSTTDMSKILTTGMAKAFPNPLPICLYPYAENSTTVNIETTLANQMREGITAWCLSNCIPDKQIPLLSTAPVLISAPNDGIDYDTFKKYYENQRSMGKRWTWLSYKPANVENAESFICQYLQSISASSLGVWKHLDPSATSILGEDLEADPKASWFPNAEVANAWKGIQSTSSQRPTIIEKIIDPDTLGTVPLHFYLRLPPGATDGAGVAGVLAYCTWVQNPDIIKQQLLMDTDRPESEMRGIGVEMLCYAARHNLAVLTWSTPGNWKPGMSFDELSKDDQKQIDKMFDVYGRVWNEGVDQMVDQYKIPPNDFLLYGISRGAQWAHRLALRRPERFLAINIHISSSYDVPTPEASQCLWLVTTGDLEHGCPFAKVFYRECQDLGYPIIFKAEENLGHDTCIEVEHLRDDFFDYALEVKKERDEKTLSKTDMAAMVAQRLKTAPFVGDYLNQEFLPASEASEVPENLRVYLPNETIAKAWAVQHVPEVTTK
jgi:hypothetical protein